MAVEPFATVDDLRDRWPSLPSDKEDTAQVLLGDASVMLRRECPDVDVRIESVPPLLDPSIPKMIVCWMVKRAMLTGDVGDGVSSHQQTAGPFSQSVSFSNPMGNLFLRSSERKMLGCGGQEAFTVDMTPPRPDPAPGWLL